MSPPTSWGWKPYIHYVSFIVTQETSITPKIRLTSVENSSPCQLGPYCAFRWVNRNIRYREKRNWQGSLMKIACQPVKTQPGYFISYSLVDIISTLAKNNDEIYTVPANLELYFPVFIQELILDISLLPSEGNWFESVCYEFVLCLRLVKIKSGPYRLLLGDGEVNHSSPVKQILLFPCEISFSNLQIENNNSPKVQCLEYWSM